MSNLQTTFGVTSVIALMCMHLAACSAPEPEPLRYGQDICDYCRMTIVDTQFGSELVTRKAKIYRFDSIECLAAFNAESKVANEEVHSLWVTDFSTSQLVDLNSATVVRSPDIKSPMGIGLLAYASKNDMNDSLLSGVAEVDWSTAKMIVSDEWNLNK